MSVNGEFLVAADTVADRRFDCWRCVIFEPPAGSVGGFGGVVIPCVQAMWMVARRRTIVLIVRCARLRFSAPEGIQAETP